MQRSTRFRGDKVDLYLYVFLFRGLMYVLKLDYVDDSARRVLNIARRGFREVECLWHNCHASLNSLERLTNHVKVHARDDENGEDKVQETLLHNTEYRLLLNQDILRCEWRNCKLEFSSQGSLAKHLKAHSTRLMPCAFEGHTSISQRCAQCIDYM